MINLHKRMLTDLAGIEPVKPPPDHQSDMQPTELPRPVKDIGKMWPKVVPLTNDFVAPT